MTKVTGRGLRAAFAAALTMFAATLSVGKSAASDAPQATSAGPAQSRSAETLYLQLGTVGLDESRVYRIREASVDRGPLHIALDEGTIAFTADVAGRVTGAFFEGDGEILLVPPNQVERSSLTLFTGSAILEERFITAYFRFNDDTFADLRPLLRPADNGREFVSQWNETALHLAEGDALRLFLSLSRFLPISGDTANTERPNSTTVSQDRMLHGRVQGRKLGAFDVYFDSQAGEQVSAGQLRAVEGTTFYDLWTSFAISQAAKPPEALNIVTGSEVSTTSAVNISHYKIRAEVKPPTDLNAEAILQIEVHQGGERTLLFELSRFLQLKEVDADGRPLQFIHNQALEGTQLARRGNDLVAVVFPQPLFTGQRMELRFSYGGAVLSEVGAGLLYVGARGTWYPNRGLAMSDYDLEFHSPPGWTLLATGKRVDTSSTGDVKGGPAANDQEVVTHWVSERPLPVAGFNLGRYSRAIAHAGDVTVETYATSGVERTFPKGAAEAIAPEPSTPPRLRSQPILIAPAPPSPARNAQPVSDAAARALEFFAQRFGPYPYSNLALTQMPGGLSQGWPGLIFLSSYSFLTPTEKSQLHMSLVETTLSEKVIAHETAHQWWGDLVLWSGYRDQWIVEALANYSSLMMLESEDPERFREVMDEYRNNLLAKRGDDPPLMEAGPVTLGARLSSSHFPAGYEAISYGRGTWLFQMLRNMMRDAGRKSAASPLSQSGDEPFVRALRKVRERYQGKSITTADLLHVFEEDLPRPLWYEGKKSLQWFYQNWVSGTAIPRLELQAAKYNDQGKSTAVSGTILQKSAPQDLVTLVPVYAVIGGKMVLLEQVFADGPETPFHLVAPSGTRKIVLDPYQTLLTRNR